MRATTLNLFDAAFLTQSSAVPAVTPETFGPVLRWYDAAWFNYKSDGALITVSDPWDDKSPNGLDAVTTMGREPTFKSAILNGKPAVRLPVGTKHLAFVGGDLNLTDFTILCIAQTAVDSLFLSKNGVNRQIRINRLSDRRASWAAESGQELVSNLFSSSALNPGMIGHRRSNTNSDLRDFEFFDNLNPVGRPVAAVSSVLFQIDQIGVIDGGPLNIDIGELVIYNKALTTGEIQSLYTSYFKPKFSLP